MGEYTEFWRKQKGEQPEDLRATQSVDSDGMLNITLNPVSRVKLNSELDITPDAAAKQFNLSNQSGVPIETVRNMQPEIEKRVEAQRFDADSIVRETSSLAKVMQDRAKAPIVKPDVEKMGFFERLYKSNAQRIERDTYMNQAAELHMKRMFSGDDSLTGEENLFLGRYNEQVDYKLGTFANAPGIILGTGGQLGAAVVDSAPLIAAGAATGAALGAVGGPAAPVTSTAGALTGAGIAASAGFAYQGFQTETGMAFAEYEQIVDNNGVPIEREVAAAGAIATGLVNGGLEAFAGTKILKNFPGMEKVFSKLGREPVRELLKNSATHGSMRRIAAAFATTGLVEGSTEGMQEAVNILFAEFSKMASEGAFDEFGPVTIINEQGEEEEVSFSAAAASRIGTAALEGAIGGGGVAAIGTGLTIGAEAVTSNRQYRRDQEVIEERKNAVRELETAERSPQTLQEFLQDLPQESYYLNADDVKTFFQSDADLNEFFTLVPEAAQQYDEAVEMGGDLVLPSSSIDYMFSQTQEFDGLQEFMKREPATLSDAELQKAIDEEIVPLIDSLDREDLTDGEVLEDRLFNEITRLRNPRISRPENARLYASLFRSSLETYQDRIGESAELQGILRDTVNRITFQDDGGRVQRPRVDQVDFLLNRIRQGGTAVRETRQSALDFIRSRGGISPSDANVGDLQAMDIDITDIPKKRGKGNRLKPKSQRTIREGGVDLDTAVDLLTEAGYFGQRPTVAEVLDVIDNELRGQPLFTPEAQEDVSVQRSEQEQDFIRVLDSLGLDAETATNQEIKDALAGLEAEDQTFFQDRGQPRGSVTFNAPDGQTIIKAFESANLSTILHETGHVFLEMQRIIAENPNAPEQIKKDWQATLDWLGVENGSQIDTAQHEKWAETFEAYLQTGKAPSAELKSAFQRFKTWLTRIYKDLIRPNVNLTPEIQGVFDRMLATEEQIESYRNFPQYQPNPAMAELLTKAEYEAYVKQYNQAMEAAKEELLKKSLRQQKNKSTKWWKEESEKIRKEITPIISQEPIHRSVHWMRTGEDFNTDFPIVMDQERLSAKIIKSDYDPGIIPSMPKGTVTRSGGLHPEVLADVMGFEDADRMLLQMANYIELPVVIERTVEQEMISRHGDMLFDGTMEAEAQEAVENTIRAKSLATELQALSRQARTKSATNAAFKEQARVAVNNIRLNKLRPNDHYRAEVRAAREAGQHIKAKDYVKAAEAKRKQLLNHHMYKESLSARDMRDKLEKYVRKFNKEKTRQTIQKDSRDQIDNILRKFQLLNSTKLQTTDVGFLQYAESRKDDADVVYTPEVILGEGGDYRTMRVENVQEIFDTLRNVEALGRDDRSILIGEQRLNAKEAVAKIDESIRENNKLKPRTDLTNSWSSRAKDMSSGLIENFTRVEFITKELDGGVINGTLAQAIMNPLRIAQGESYERMIDLNNRLREILDKNPGVRDWYKKKKYRFEDGRSLKMNRGNMVMAVLNMGNASNMKNLTDKEGHNFSDSDIQMIKNELTKEDYQTVQDIWDLFEGMRPEVEKVHREMSNLDMKLVEPQELVTPFGILKGGYVPIVHDPKAAVKKPAAKQGVTVNEENFSFPAVGKGFTKNRSAFVSQVMLDFDVVIHKHLRETTHFVTHAAPVRQVNRIISSTDFRAAVQETAGPNALSEFEPWLIAVARNTVYDAPVSALDALVRHLRVGTSQLYLGLGTGTAVKQTLGILTTEAAVARGDLKQKNFLRAMRDLATKPLEVSDFAFANSKIMAERLTGVDADTAVALRGGWQNNLLTKAQKAGFLPLVYTQVYAVDVPTWNAGYLEGLERHNGSHDQAVAYADALLVQTQGSGNVMDLARVQRGNELQRAAVTMFGTYFLGVLFPTLRQSFRDVSVRKNPKKAALTLVPLIVLSSVLESYMSNDEPEDDETLAEWIALKSVLYGVSSVPLAGGFVGSLASGFDYRLSAIEGPIGDIKRGLADFSDLDPDQRAVKGAVMATGLFFKLPTYNPYKMIDEIIEVSEGEDDFSFREVFLGAREDKK